MTEDELSEEIQNMLVWRDYFTLLRDGIDESWAEDRGYSKDEYVEIDGWLNIIIMQIQVQAMNEAPVDGSSDLELREFTSMEGVTDVRDW